MAVNQTLLEKSVLDRYFTIPAENGKSQCMYVWIDGSGEHLRCKTRTLDFVPQSVSDLPEWNFDGSSTGQAARTENSDVYLRPVAMFNCPFRGGDNKLVMCETYKHDKKPTETNFRRSCNAVMDRAKDAKPWFAIEQEYTLLGRDGYPFGWPRGGFPKAQNTYFCGVGAHNAYGRDILEAHYRACLYAGIKIAGTNCEKMPAQWEYQIGPLDSVELGDQFWMARFILHRIAEDFGVVVTLDPKPVAGDWNDASAHCNFSTEAMRQKGGITEIQKAVRKLSKQHARHIRAYDPKGGKDNERRLTGTRETSHISDFTSGTSFHNTSVRIPCKVMVDGCGYLEDRRPASNCDPYRVMEMMIRTVLLGEWTD